jgi:L,D-transpeptidase YcbB
MLIRFIVLCLFMSFLNLQGWAQLPVKATIDQMVLRNSKASVESIYEQNHFQYIWMTRPVARQQLMNLISSAADFALDEKTYQHDVLQKKIPASATSSRDSLISDIIMTDVAIQLFKDLKNGNRPPSFSYDGLKYSPDVSTIPAALLRALASHDLYQLAVNIQPASPAYLNMLEKFRHLKKASAQTESEVPVRSAKVNDQNLPLLARLYQLGITDTLVTRISEKELGEKIRSVQSLFSLLPDGTVRSTLLTELNVPLRVRIETLAQAINHYRWMHGMKRFVGVVNIPSASLFIYRDGEMVFDSKLIVGKKATPTPTLSSTISEVILYPYWNVPHGIATKELLPSIKKNRGYLAAHNFQVLNKQGKVLDPYSINWHALSTANFPYLIRQSTGCDNSLGIVKFNFYNPFTVYLHDTPAKGLFLMNKRYFSHGCMRVEKPVEFGQLLLGRNRIAIDTLTLKGCLKSQAPKTVAVEEKLPLIVMYSTVWFDEQGRVRFFEDVYGRVAKKQLTAGANVPLTSGQQVLNSPAWE